MRLLVAAGGTGGHVYPALVVVRELLRHFGPSEGNDAVLWLGGTDGLEREIVRREGIAFESIAAAPVVGRGLLSWINALGSTGRGGLQARSIMRCFKPDAVFTTGGYVSAPAVMAAWARHCPCLIFLPDMYPGMAVRRLAGLAQRVAVSFPEVMPLFSADKVVLTGYPVRETLYQLDRDEARGHFGVDRDRFMLLVMGGSQGAHSINRALGQKLERLLSRMEIVHSIGSYDYDDMMEVRAALPARLAVRYHPYRYLHERMADALVAADLVVARAGAATLAEFPAVGLAAILVPYPYSGQHQWHNADYLVERGAAIAISDDEIDTRLADAVESLMDDEVQRREMSLAARRLAVPEAAENIAHELLKLMDGGTNG